MKVRKVYSGLLFTGMLLGSYIVQAQEVQTSEVVSNAGVFYISPGTIVSSKFNLENVDVGNFENNGELFLFNNFHNEGSFSYAPTLKTGKVYFEKSGEKVLITGGENPTFFNNVSFDSEKGIDVQNAISIAGQSDFERGHVVVNVPLSGTITYFEGATISGVNDDRHVVGPVEREGKTEREMPVGDGSHYRPITLGDSKGIKDLFSAEYKHENPLTSRPHTSGKNPIVEIDNAEYWDVNTSVKDGAVILTLSWNEATTPSSIYNKADGLALHVLSWDESNKQWKDEGGVVDVQNKTVVTPIAVNATGVFTLGLVDEHYNDEVIIYTAVTPGAGTNEYFRIENINRYPNKVEIYNRWGSKVYNTNNYDRNGDGSENVFTGKAEGKGVIGNGKLPSGTYYYIVQYEVQDASGSRWVKKAAYLHLENN
ncbi:gliding motility-associated C-terminal domain-containing protein [Myroides injenensis]|uniref:gliding motility-associated C-terminal domain-containing protein n=1 Tax=Myroides injenensis TaxID=1183151 RepID=UPI00028937E3|nr:gliding motility-associated C-terminal domain-containing protein [Myroides injenensis]